MLELDAVTVRYGSHQALDGVALDVARGEVVSILGPSGSGKTTLLRAVAGLERPVGGRIRWAGRDVTDVPVHRRRFGLMFQDYALFPQRDVAGNVGFGLRMDGRSRDEVRARVTEALALVGLGGMDRRSVTSLSGGEQQRVALARALAPAPELLMLDEPLGSLDRALRERLPLELRDLFRTLGLTTLYVTHDQEEAFSVGDRTVILRDGRIAADGPPEELWRDPPDPFVARFLGFHNVAEGELRDGVAATPWGLLPVTERAASGRERRWILVRPDRFRPVVDGSVGAGVLRGRVAARIFRGDHVLLRLDVDGALLEVTARWTPLPIVGETIALSAAPDAVAVLGAEPAAERQGDAPAGG